MNSLLHGKAFVYGPNIDTDQIYPGRFLDLTDPDQVGQHAMAGADPEFVNQFVPGDMIVAATNFGCGSSREHAAVTLKAVGVGAIVAESFARIFYRNAVNLGIPVIICPEIAAKVSKGDVLAIDLTTGQITNQINGVILQGKPLSEHVLNILENGGIKALVRKQYAK